MLVVSTHLKNMLVKLEIFPKVRGEDSLKKIELAPPRLLLNEGEKKLVLNGVDMIEKI